MNSNVGPFDGWFRILLFVVSLCYAIVAGTTLAWLMVIPGFIFFASAVLMWCPIYAMLGLNTNTGNKTV